MRVISGFLKGKKILQPVDKNTRPLKDITKESIFNALAHSNLLDFNIKHSLVLDVFSGTGSFGIECLSRGAKKVFFVENYEPALVILRKNIERFNLKSSCEIMNNYTFLERLNIKNFDLVFFDPPFKNENCNEILDLFKKKNIINTETLIILHRHKKSNEKISNFFKIFDVRQYGISKIIYLKLS